MLYLCSVLGLLGFVSYVISAFHIGAPAGETYSDVGNALLLFTTVLLLFNLSLRKKQA